jgi:predicted N-acetyltransferase YhbS
MEWMIREMRSDDLDFAYGCTLSVGWFGEGKDIFRIFLEHDPRGCLVAEVEGRRAGICIATPYLKNGFIGELVVIREMRIFGIGRHLFKRALDTLGAQGIPNIYLDGDLNAVPFYESSGFKKICRSLRFKGKVKGKKHLGIRRAQPSDIDRICRLDGDLFGDDRSFFLRARAALHPELCLVQEKQDRLLGYIMAMPAEGLTSVGPWAAVNPDGSAMLLLEHLAFQIPESVLRIGVLEKNEDAVKLIRSQPGLEEAPFSWFMVHGPSTRLGLHPALYAIGSAAKG